MAAKTKRTPMDSKTLANVAQYMIGTRRAEEVRNSEIHEWVKDRVCSIYVPKKASAEYRQLVDQSKFNILQLLIDSLAKNFFIDGYRPARASENAEVWNKVWQPNRMDGRQAGIWRPTLEYGVGYTTTLPGVIGDQKTAVITPWSPRRLTAVYADPINDEWAMYAMTVGFNRPEFGPTGVNMVTPLTIYDDWYEYKFNAPATVMATQRYEFGRPQPMYIGEITVNTESMTASEHGLGYVPVVRYMDTMGELDDGPQGIVWPMIPAQKQLNQTTFSLGMAELYAIFRQKYVTGLELQLDEDGNPKEPFNIAVDKLLQAEDSETKFGEFSQTDVSGYLDSRDKTLLYVTAVRQIEPHTMVVGDAVSNVSAEALAALANSHGQDIAEHKSSFGESAEQNMRLAGKAMGDEQAWLDMSAQVRWRDTTPRSLAQVADALGKMAQMLEVPPEELWEKIPDVTDQDLERWKKAHKERDSIAKLGGLINDAKPGRTPANSGAPGTSGGDS